MGRRVVVRHLTALGATDVLGELAAIDDDILVVRTEAGEERRIARADVIAGKPVGPRPPRYSEILELERIADEAWPAPEVELLGAWRLRAASGFTNRANSALPLGDPGCSLDEAVRACVTFYTDRGLPPKITVPLPVRRDVARHLEAAGWFAQPTVLVQTAPIAPIATVGAAGAERATVHERPPPGFLAVVAARKEVLPPAADHVLTAVDAVRFAVAYDAGGAIVATARGAVVEGPARRPGSTAAELRPAPGASQRSEERTVGAGTSSPERGADRAAPTQRWLHLSLVEVAPSARRQGLARAVSASLAAWGQAAGATQAVLQVEQANTPAVRLYESLGFRTHHTYVTYRAPAP